MQMNIMINKSSFIKNPYPYYEKLRKSDKPYFVSNLKDRKNGGMWLFSRYEDALVIFKGNSKISKEIRFHRPEGISSIFDLNMLSRDSIDHSRLRELITKYFSFKYIDGLKENISMLAQQLIDDLKNKKEIDLIRDFAEPLPLITIVDMMGISREDVSKIRKWSLIIGNGFDSLFVSENALEQQKIALKEFFYYIEELIKVKKDANDGKIVYALIKANEKNELSYDELVSMVGFLLIAGHETTINLIGNGLWLLLSHPDQLQLLLDDINLLPLAVEEILRYESPSQRSTFRIALDSFEINGTKLNKGDMFAVFIGSANRDEKEFENSEKFDITRDPNRHIAFGTGIHNCLGKNLARLEAQIAFQKILEYLPKIKLKETEPNWRKNSFFRGLEKLEVRLN